jgi:hypothetical protein
MKLFFVRHVVHGLLFRPFAREAAFREPQSEGEIIGVPDILKVIRVSQHN